MRARQLSAALLLAAASVVRGPAGPTSPALEAVARLAAGATLELRGEHLLEAPLVVPPHARLRGPARLRAAPDTQLDHLIELREGATLEDIDLDGAGLTPPAPDWTEQTGAPRGVGVVMTGTATALLRGARIQRCRFTHFSGGGVFARYTADAVLDGLRAEHMQQGALQETCAVFAFYDSVRPQIVGCLIRNYRWKGFYFKHCTEALARDDFAEDGPADHASHYARFSQDVTFRGGGATGAFGLKTFGCVRVRVEEMSFVRVATGVFIDATSDAGVLRNRVTDSTRQGIIVGSEEGHPPSRRVRVRENAIVTAHRDTTPNSSGIQLVSLGAHSPVLDVEISHNEIAGYFWGISFLPGAQPQYDALLLNDNRLASLRQYGVVGPVDRLQMHRNRIELQGSVAEKFVAVWPATSAERTLELADNTWIGGRDFGLELGRADGKFSRVTLENNRHAPPP